MSQENLVGQNILGYNVKKIIHSGAFGTVYEVVKSNISGTYSRALKHMAIPSNTQYISVLNSMGGDESKVKDYFSKMLKNISTEIGILSQLSDEDSTHIVRYYENDIQIHENPLRYDIFILMEYLTPLEDFLGKNKFTVEDVLKLGLDILQGLKTCHDNNIIHRDIKEGNIFVAGSGNYKIGDFGVSKILKHSSNAESFKGTPNYLAPEIRNDKKGYTKSVDLYSLGIVLYRLLNYNRNPFVPYYPSVYDYEDENIAFEKRMNGEIPGLPLLGGEAVGKIIIRSLQGSSERFQTANEFFEALREAMEQTPRNILEENVIITPLKETLNSNSANYANTLVDSELDNSESSKKENEEIRNTDIFQTQSSLEEIQVNNPNIIADLNFSENTSDVSEDTRTNSENEVFDKLIFFMPVIIFFIGVVAYFFIIPNIYGKSVSFLEWLFSDSQTIVETLRNEDIVFEKVNGIVFTGVFCWLWLGSFTFSLFLVGKKLNSPAELNQNLSLTKQEIFFTLQEINFMLGDLKRKNQLREVEDFSYAMKQLENNIAIESDFGYGNSAVINCENDIAKKIRELKLLVSSAGSGKIIENVKELNDILRNINSLLKQRSELKKRH